MAEYIKREDALGCVLGVFDRQRIKELPAADVEEVKHGKWIQEQIKIENMSIVRYRNTCSECGGKADFLLRELHYSYRPHCGAKMDLED